jgi:hypothetical protein
VDQREGRRRIVHAIDGGEDVRGHDASLDEVADEGGAEDLATYELAGKRGGEKAGDVGTRDDLE